MNEDRVNKEFKAIRTSHNRGVNSTDLLGFPIFIIELRRLVIYAKYPYNHSDTEPGEIPNKRL